MNTFFVTIKEQTGFIRGANPAARKETVGQLRKNILHLRGGLEHFSLLAKTAQKNATMSSR